MIYLIRKQYRLRLFNDSDIEVSDVVAICQELNNADVIFQSQKPVVYNEHIVTGAKSILLILEAYDLETGKTQCLKEFHS